MTTPTTAEPPVPICSCIEYWPGDGHAPDCPVLREILAARATIARLEGERDAARRILDATAEAVGFARTYDPSTLPAFVAHNRTRAATERGVGYDEALGRTYLIAMTPPGTDESGTPKGTDLLTALAELDVRADGYSYAAFGPATRAELVNIHNQLTAATECVSAARKARSLIDEAMGDTDPDDDDPLLRACQVLTDALHNLDAALAAASGAASQAPDESDSALLDWYERNPYRVSHAMGLGGDKSTWCSVGLDFEIHECVSLRDAIRKARAAASGDTATTEG